MESVLSGVCRLFADLCAIPHPSRGEAQIVAYLSNALTRLGYAPEQDEALNLRCTLPATPGMEDTPPVLLQAHTDMVCVSAPGSGWIPGESQVTLVNDGTFLRSDGRSTLGADNGIAVAVMLYLAQRKDLSHGRVELLFTSCEEQGLVGAAALNPQWLQNCTYYINLDAFRNDAAIFASAGGLRQSWTHPVCCIPNERPNAFTVTVSGLIGGHSGFDINRGRGNAISLLAKLLSGLDCSVSSFTGGSSYNAIPTYAQALICTDHPEELMRSVAEAERTLKDRFGSCEPELSLTAQACSSPKTCWDEETQREILNFLRQLPQGALEWRTDCENTVAKSGNPAVVSQTEDTLEVRHFARCATFDYMDEITDCTAALSKEFHFTQNSVSRYSPWEGSGENPFLRRVQACYRDLTGQDMEAVAVHVGLECSRIMEKAPQLSGVSLGAEISDAHSVSERVTLDSISTLTNLVIKLLNNLPKEDQQ